MNYKNSTQILGVSPALDDKGIKRAYQNLANKSNPIINQDNIQKMAFPKFSGDVQLTYPAAIQGGYTPVIGYVLF